MRAVSGMQLAGEVLEYLNSTITSKGSKKFGIQFGAYATFFSFFGLADLPQANADFRGVTSYASSMVFELFTPQNDTTAADVTTDDLYVRFLYHNGTASDSSEPVAYPLFGGSNTSVSWNDFVDGMDKFAIRSTEQWCTKCGNTTGSCAAYADSASSSSSGSNEGKSSGGSNGISTAVGGVIGAMVTLAVVLGLEALVMVVGGFRLAKKNKAPAASAAPEAAEAKA